MFCINYQTNFINFHLCRIQRYLRLLLISFWDVCVVCIRANVQNIPTYVGLQNRRWSEKKQTNHQKWIYTRTNEHTNANRLQPASSQNYSRIIEEERKITTTQRENVFRFATNKLVATIRNGVVWKMHCGNMRNTAVRCTNARRKLLYLRIQFLILGEQRQHMICLTLHYGSCDFHWTDERKGTAREKEWEKNENVKLVVLHTVLFICIKFHTVIIARNFTYMRVVISSDVTCKRARSHI